MNAPSLLLDVPCPLCELPLELDFTCMEDGNLPPPPRPTPPKAEATFTARFDGHCRGCNLPIGAGQIIHRMSDETYRHQGCAG